MTRTTARSARLAGGLLAGALVLAGCSNDTEGMEGMGGSSSASSSAESSTTSEAGNFNEADVTFAQDMIVHHRGAIAMAQLAEGRAEDPRVLDLASRIEAAQQPEIDTLTGWLEEWGEDVPEEMDMSMEGMEDMDMGGMDMDTSGLEAASGLEFDRMFLEMMTEHHRGAVDMAETQVAEGSYPDAIAMAEDIIESQSAEIEEMQTILADLDA